jgi:hypothetical protein
MSFGGSHEQEKQKNAKACGPQVHSLPGSARFGAIRENSRLIKIGDGCSGLVVDLSG